MDGLFAWAQERAKDLDAPTTLTSDEAHALQIALGWALDGDRSGGGLVLDRLIRWELTRTRGTATLEIAHRVLDRPAPTTVDEVLLHVSAVRFLGGPELHPDGAARSHRRHRGDGPAAG